MDRHLRKKVILFVILFLSLSSRGQGSHSAIEDVLNAFKSSRIQDMTKYFDNFVPLNIDNTPSNYSSNQAELVLQDFLEKNPPHDFLIISSGSPSETSKFAIAVFNTPNGHHSVYILMKKKDRNFVIKEIRIIKD